MMSGKRTCAGPTCAGPTCRGPTWRAPTCRRPACGGQPAARPTCATPTCRGTCLQRRPTSQQGPTWRGQPPGGRPGRRQPAGGRPGRGQPPGGQPVGANLQEAILRSANLQEANLGGANLQEADLCGANLQGAIYEPKPGTLPSFWTLTHPDNHLETLVFHNSPAALIALREAFKKGGMRTQERQLTYAIEHTKQLQAWNPSWYDPEERTRGRGWRSWLARARVCSATCCSSSRLATAWSPAVPSPHSVS